MKVVVGCDHGGLTLKEVVKSRLVELGHDVVDLGTHTSASTDYPNYARQVATQVADGLGDRGVLVCGTGQGMAMAANKVKGVRAAVVADVFSAQMAMEHNDARVLCLGERVVGSSLAIKCLESWLEAEFQGGRHSRRVGLISAIEEIRANRAEVD